MIRNVAKFTLLDTLLELIYSLLVLVGLVALTSKLSFNIVVLIAGTIAYVAAVIAFYIFVVRRLRKFFESK